MCFPPAWVLAWFADCPVGKTQDPEGTDSVCELFPLKDMACGTS